MAPRFSELYIVTASRSNATGVDAHAGGRNFAFRWPSIFPLIVRNIAENPHTQLPVTERPRYREIFPFFFKSQSLKINFSSRKQRNPPRKEHTPQLIAKINPMDARGVHYHVALHSKSHSAAIDSYRAFYLRQRKPKRKLPKTL